MLIERLPLATQDYTARQAGRMLQRLLETQTALASVTIDIASSDGDGEALLQKATGLAAEVERGRACRASERPVVDARRHPR